MVNEKVKRTLIDQNPFWKAPFWVDYKERRAYPQIKRLLCEPQIISLCGLRRVGKTTLLQNAISDLLKEHPADSILYFSFDDFPEQELFLVLDAFREMHGKEPKFLIFDEIQKVQNWAEKVKILYDTKKYKIMVSGSESLFLKKGSRESLAGRIYELEITCLSFAEYLGFAGKAEMAKKPQLYGTELKRELEKYLLCAGFPELIGKDRTLAARYLKSAVLEKIIFMDLPRLYPIENPAQLLSIFEILSENPGMLLDFSSLSQKLGISRQTLSKYFEYLESGHLVTKLYNFSKNRLTSEKRLRKFYPAFITYPLFASPDKAHMGKIMENLCAIASGAKFFWRDKQKDEVDIILQEEGKLIPIEVKYQNTPQQNSGLLKFCKKYKCKSAFLVTEGTRKKENGEKENGELLTEWLPICDFLLKFGK